MREIIKRYELDDNLTINKLDKSEFIRRREFDENKSKILYYYSKELCDSVEVQITIYPYDHIVHDEFDDTNDIKIYDSYNERIFSAFYDEERDYPFVNDLIKEYNRAMDELVEKGIFKEKKLTEEPKTLKKIIKE